MWTTKISGARKRRSEREKAAKRGGGGKKYTRMLAARSLRSYRARGFDDLLTTGPDKEKRRMSYENRARVKAPIVGMNGEGHFLFGRGRTKKKSRDYSRDQLSPDRPPLPPNRFLRRTTCGLCWTPCSTRDSSRDMISQTRNFLSLAQLCM